MTISGTKIPVARAAADLRQTLTGWRDAGRRVALVPTMGALHEGHLALVREARARGDQVVVSVFVNPAQFAPHEDLATYPRTLPRDLELLTAQQVTVGEAVRKASAVFLPQVQNMYPSGISQNISVQNGTFVEVKGYGHQMEVR